MESLNINLTNIYKSRFDEEILNLFNKPWLVTNKDNNNFSFSKKETKRSGFLVIRKYIWRAGATNC